MKHDLHTRVRNAMFGLAIGDALSWPAMFHRSYLLPFWTRRIRREIDAATENTSAISISLPFALNRPAEAFALGPADDTEWAAFTLSNILQQRGDLNHASALAPWRGLASSSDIRGSVGILAALANLHKAKEPPASGHDHPHYFDDSAIPRAVPIGALWAGDPAQAAAAAAMEAQITNAEEGVWAAQAMAAGISAACGGEPLDLVLHRAVSQLPEESWIHRTVAEAFALCNLEKSSLELVPELSAAIINREYNYGNAAPETLALAFAIVKQTRGQFENAVMLAAAFAKTADSVPAFVGALCGALSDLEILTPPWRECLHQLHGICIPALAGLDFIGMVEQLAELALRRKAA